MDEEQKQTIMFQTVGAKRLKVCYARLTSWYEKGSLGSLSHWVIEMLTNTQEISSHKMWERFPCLGKLALDHKTGRGIGHLQVDEKTSHQRSCPLRQNLLKEKIHGTDWKQPLVGFRLCRRSPLS